MNQVPIRKFSARQRLRSFVFAFDGFVYFFSREHNAWIHGVAAVIVLVAAFLLKISAFEMIAVLIAIALVWISEMLNTAVERIMDHLSPAQHPDVKVIKDLAAAAVLVSASIAFIIGIIIFIPKFL